MKVFAEFTQEKLYEILFPERTKNLDINCYAGNYLILIYMGYFDYLFYIGGGAKSPPPRSNYGI